MAAISDRIFELIHSRGITQKEFAKRTGIAESTISDWKRRRVNPASEKILIICDVLNVSPEELLSGARPRGNRSRNPEGIMISRETEEGRLLELYDQCDSRQKARLLGYAMALAEKEETGESKTNE